VRDVGLTVGARERIRSLRTKISMLEMSYDTRGNKYKLVPKLCKCELRKQFFVNRVVKLGNMLPDEVVSMCE